MANELEVRCSIQIRSGSFLYQSQPTYYTTSLSRIKGPVPGAITVPVTGVVVNFAELTQPGECWFQNIDITNFVTVGIYDSARFYPFMELRPGRQCNVPLSRYLNQEFVGTGTGTNADINKLMLIADTAPCIVRVDGFDS